VFGVVSAKISISCIAFQGGIFLRGLFGVRQFLEKGLGPV
jgi:hypothetical protein